MAWTRIAWVVVLAAGLFCPAAGFAQEGQPAPADAAAQAGAAGDEAPGLTAGEALGEAPDGAEQSGEAGGDEPVTWGMALIIKLIDAGWTMAVLLIISIFGVAYSVERLVNLRKGVIVPDGLADQASALWQQKDLEGVARLTADRPSTLGRVIDAVVKYRRKSAAEVSVIAGDIASRDLRRHLMRAYPLAVVATISPLVGLLGTVIGMIGAFDTVLALGEMADPAAFAGDISLALITTGVGLTIAVPALSLYHFFKSRTSFFGILLEEQASELIADWLDDDVAHGAASPETEKANGDSAAKPTPEGEPAAEAKTEAAHAD